MNYSIEHEGECPELPVSRKGDRPKLVRRGPLPKPRQQKTITKGIRKRR